MYQDNLPEKPNPMQNWMMQMPGLSNIFQNAVPADIPAMTYGANPFQMIGGNWKRKQLAKAKKYEAEMAEDALRATKAYLETNKSLMTFSSDIQDHFLGNNHKQNMRVLEAKHQEADLYLKSLESKRIEAEVTKLNYETALLANNVKLGEIEFKIQENKLNEMLQLTGGINV